MSYFDLSIYSPEGVILKSLRCGSLKVPTKLGEINILPGHTHIIAELDTGIVEVKTQEGSLRHFSVTTGLCKVLDQTVKLTSTTSERAEEIDLERAKSALSKAQSRLASDEILTDVELIKFQRKLKRANTRIRLAERANQQI